MIRNFQEMDARFGERAVSAGRLALPWNARHAAGSKPYLLSIHRVEDLPEITCPHCGRQMKRRGQRLKAAKPSASSLQSTALYSCRCGWGFLVLPTGAYSPRDARLGSDPAALLPCWPDTPRQKSWQPELTEADLPPEEIAARAAVMRAFRERGRKLALTEAHPWGRKSPADLAALLDIYGDEEEIPCYED